MTAVSSHMAEMASRTYPGGWVGALSRATTRKGGPGVYTPGPLRYRHVPQGEDVIHSADLREWRNRSVVDPKGHKIGVLEAVYVDTTTDEPAMATVRTGLPTRHPAGETSGKGSDPQRGSGP